MTVQTSTRIPQSRAIVTELPGPRSRALAGRRSEAVAAGASSAHGSFIAEADRGILVDVDGNRFIDLASGIAVTGVGASNPAVAEAVARQAALFTHSCATVSPYELYVQVCESLNALTPGTHAKRSLLVTTGAEAVENAVKIARHATGRPAIVVLDHAYHGRTNLTMAMTAKNRPYKDGFGPFAPEIYRVPGSYPFRDGLSGPDAAARTIDHIHRLVGESRTAAVVVEPVQGEGGFIVPADGYLETLAEWLHGEGILLVADEIQAGFCRTGRWFASEHWGIVPDLVTTAKGLAGGLPLAAVTGRAEIMDAVHAGGLGGTYAGNPIACAAAIATIDEMRSLELAAAADRLGSRMRSALDSAARRSPSIGEVRGLGAMQAVELVEAGTSAPGLADAVAREAYRRGLIVLVCGSYGNVIRLLPPLVIGEKLLDEALAELTGIIVELGGR